MGGFVTFQHADVHGVVGPLGDAQHHVQTFFDLSFPLLAARQQLLRSPKTQPFVLLSPNEHQETVNDAAPPAHRGTRRSRVDGHGTQKTFDALICPRSELLRPQIGSTPV